MKKQYLLTSALIFLVAVVVTLTAILLISNMRRATASETLPAITRIEIKNGGMELKQGDIRVLEIAVYPKNVDTNGISITSSNNSVVQIVDGRIKAIADGQAVVSATAENGVYASCSISVKTPYEIKGRLTIGTYELSNGQTIEYFSDYKDYVVKYFALTSYQRSNWSYEEDGQYVRLSGQVISVSSEGIIEISFGTGKSDEKVYAYMTLAASQSNLLYDIAESDRIEAFARIDAHSYKNTGWWYDYLHFTLYDGIIVNRNTSYAEIPESYVPVAPIQHSSYSRDTSSDSTERLKDTEDFSEYILPNSNSAYITEKDLYGLTALELKIARNEIYARHGRRFNDEYLQTYFDSKIWYLGRIEPNDFDNNYGYLLNDYELKNIELIVKLESNS